MQHEMRSMNFEYNGMPNNTYVCYDDLKDLVKRGNEKCNNVGLWKSGSGAIIDNILYYNVMLEDE